MGLSRRMKLEVTSDKRQMMSPFHLPLSLIHTICYRTESLLAGNYVVSVCTPLQNSPATVVHYLCSDEKRLGFFAIKVVLIKILKVYKGQVRQNHSFY